MPGQTQSRQSQPSEVEELRLRLAEAEETLCAIRSGEIDALVIAGPDGDQVYTLKGADYPYRRLVEEMSEGAVTFTPDGVILYSNRRFAEILRRPIETVIGSLIQTFILPDDRSVFEALLRQAENNMGKGEVRLWVDEGLSVPVYLSITRLSLEETRVFSALVTDLTEHKRQQDIVAAEQLARSILDQAVESVIVCDQNGQVIRANRAAMELCNTNPAHQPFEKAFPLAESAQRDDPPNGLAPFSLSGVLSGQMLRGMETILQRDSGTAIPLLMSAAPLLNEQETIMGCVVTLTEITERKQMEEALRQARDELEVRVEDRTRQLAAAYSALQAEVAERERVQAELIEMQRRLIEGREAERLYLAQELHDGPVQELYAIIYQLAQEDATLDKTSRSRLVASRAAIQRVINTMRAISNELRPPMLVSFGLEKAVRSHVEHLRRDHPDLEIHLQLMPDQGLLSDRVRLALFRIYQHAISNVVRHARAQRVAIRFQLDAEQAMLEIQDDGRGFEVPAHRLDLARKGHLGLVGAAERVEAVGGQLTILSTPGKGTLIRAIVPATSEEKSEASLSA